MNHLETLKNELVNQKNILESKNYTVPTQNLYPSPSEISASLNMILDNVPEVSQFSSYYKTLCDPSTYNTIISNLQLPTGITSIRPYAFSHLGANLTGTVTFPSTLTEISERAFLVTNITNITLHDGITTIGNYAFSECEKLQNAIIPNSVTSLGSYAFYKSNDIETIQIPNSISELPNSTFRDLNKLTSLTIPANITKLASGNFYTIPLVENIYLMGNTTLATSNTFATHNNNLKIWVNFDLFGTYATQTNYSKVKDHLISEVTVTDASFPTSSVSLKWYSSIENATNNTNAITSPSGSATYYCKLA